MVKKLSIIFVIIVVFFLAIFSGIYLVKNNKIGLKNGKDYISKEEIKQLEAAKVVSSKEEKIGTNTNVLLKRNYSLCGHTQEEEAKQFEFVNLTKQDLQEKYKDWKIITFSQYDVELEQEVDGLCDEHYFVTEENGFIVVYRRKVDEETGQVGKEEYITTDISVEYLPEEDLNNLMEGEEIYSKEALNKFLEDYE